MILVAIASTLLISFVVVRIVGFVRARLARGPTFGGDSTMDDTLPDPENPKQGTQVEFRAFAPEAAPPNSTVLVRVVAAVHDALEEATAQAHEALAAIGHDAIVGTRGLPAKSIHGPAALSVRINVDDNDVVLLSERTQYQILPSPLPADLAASFDFLLKLGSTSGPALRCEFEVLVGPLVVSVLQSVVVVTDDLATAAHNTQRAAPFERVFISYSRLDIDVADAVGAACAALGVDPLIDNDILRAGDQWSVALLDRIDDADVFQLLWSERSANSSEVEREWRHAMDRRDTGMKPERFIRPFYWDDPPPAIPAELASTQFTYVPHLAPRS